MITTYILQFLLSLLAIILTVIQAVNIATFNLSPALPFGMDAVLQTGVGYLYLVFQWFPPLQIMFTGFLAVLSIRVMLLLLRVFKILT